MSRGMALAVRCAITRTAVALALTGIAATDATLPANATPGFAGVPVRPLRSTIPILGFPPTRMIPCARRCHW